MLLHLHHHLIRHTPFRYILSLELLVLRRIHIEFAILQDKLWISCHVMGLSFLLLLLELVIICLFLGHTSLILKLE